MCKIIIFTNTAKIQLLPEFTDFMREILADQRDGFGYAIQNADNSVFGGRTLKPSMPLSQNNIPWCEINGETFGKRLEGATKAGMFHGRISTNSVSLLNTHPISKNDWHLIHNGVVQDTAEGAATKPRKTNNDSEFVLDHLAEGGIEAVERNLTGYYAVGAFDPTGRLHVFRDKQARLQCCWSEKLSSYIFATTELLIEKIAEMLDEALFPVTVKDDTYITFDNGVPTSQVTFASRGYGWAEAQHAAKSLGRELPSPTLGVKGSSAKTERERFIDQSAYDKYTDKYSDPYAHLDKADVDILDNISDEFLDLLDVIDDSYQIHDARGRMLTATAFCKMRLVDQVQCSIKDLDGKKIRKFRKKDKTERKAYAKSQAV